MSEKIKYTEAFEELQQIVSDLEKGETTVDQLAEQVRRAAFLIGICKEKLTATELDVKNILLELESDKDLLKPI